MSLFQLTNASISKLCSFLFWGNLYIIIVQVWPSMSKEWSSRVVALLHSTVCTIVGFMQCRALNAGCFKIVDKLLSPSVYALMLWSWGYFAFDLLWCLLNWPKAYVFFYHHICSMIAITMCMREDYVGGVYACSIFLFEITNPLLQIRWFLKNSGKTDTTLYWMVEFMYLFLFLFMRIIYGSYMTYNIVMSGPVSKELKVVSFNLYLASLIFIYQIVGYVRYRYRAYLDELLREPSIPYLVEGV